MTIKYTIVSGDTLTKIAKKFGRPSWQSIYNAPENAAFRHKRPNPSLIFPGDVILIPGVDNGSSAPPTVVGSLPVSGPPISSWRDTSISMSGPWVIVSLDASRVRLRFWKRNSGQIDDSGLDLGMGGSVGGLLGKFPGLGGNTIGQTNGIAKFEMWTSTITGSIRPGIAFTGGFQSQPPGFEFIGKVMVKGIWDKVTSHDDYAPHRASLSYFSDKDKSASGRNFAFNLGVPPGAADYGLGGLISILDEGKPGPDHVSGWKAAVSGGAKIGRTIVAQRNADNLLMLALQSDPSQSVRGMSVDSPGPFNPDRYLSPTEIQKTLLNECFDNAMFLDGSDSLYLDYLGTRIIDPSPYKKCVNQTIASFDRVATDTA